jgi:DNA-binding response OmpR family regulator
MNTNVYDALPAQLATVLVVDADAVFLEFEARTLTDRGYNVLKASRRGEALSLCRQNANIGLLLHGSPIHEPDTLELTQQFQRAHSGAPVLLLLWSLEEFDERFNKLARVEMMAKPFELKELIYNVQRLLADVHGSSVDNHRGRTLSPRASPVPRRVRGNAKEPPSRIFSMQTESNVQTNSCRSYNALSIPRGTDRLQGPFESRAFPS